MLDSIRKLFRYRIFEVPFAILLKYNVFPWLVKRIIPSNHLYEPQSYRTVDRLGVRFQLDLNDYQDWIIFYYSKEDSSEKILGYIDNDAKTILDIGGNIGQTSLYIAQKYQVSTPEIISFEPYPSTYKKFVHNLNLNPIHKDNITIECLGLGKEEGELNMLIECETNSGGNRITHEAIDVQMSGLEKVPVITLDKYILNKKLETVDFIKIDVEGYEFSVLEGAIDTLETYKPDIFLEVDDTNLRKQGSSTKKLFTFLKDRGYTFKNADSGKKIQNFVDIKHNLHFDLFCKHLSKTN